MLANFKNDVNVPCILLNIDSNTVEKTLTLLVLKFGEELKTENRSIEDYLSVALRTPQVQSSISGTEHLMIDVKASALVDLTKNLLKIDADKVINDIKRRQIPRFADAPIGASTLDCIEKFQKELNNLELCNWLKDFKIQDMTLLTELQQMSMIQNEIQLIGSLTASDFQTGN